MLLKNDQGSGPRITENDFSNIFREIKRIQDIIGQHGGIVGDQIKNYPVLNIILPIVEIYKVEDKLREEDFIELFIKGIKFKLVCHEDGAFAVESC
jgi:hypothetical protein